MIGATISFESLPRESVRPSNVHNSGRDGGLNTLPRVVAADLAYNLYHDDYSGNCLAVTDDGAISFPTQFDDE